MSDPQTPHELMLVRALRAARLHVIMLTDSITDLTGSLMEVSDDKLRAKWAELGVNTRKLTAEGVEIYDEAIKQATPVVDYGPCPKGDKHEMSDDGMNCAKCAAFILF